MKLIHVFSVFFLFMSIWILLPHHSDILSHFMYFNFLALFFLFFLSPLHLKNNISLIGTRASSLSCVVFFPAPCCFSARPSAFALLPHSSCPWFLSSFSSFFDVPLGALSSSFLPSWMRCSIGKVLADSSYPVWRVMPGQDTYSGVLHLLYYAVGWSDSSSSFRVVCTVPLSKVRKMKVPHNLESIC